MQYVQMFHHAIEIMIMYTQWFNFLQNRAYNVDKITTGYITTDTRMHNWSQILGALVTYIILWEWR